MKRLIVADSAGFCFGVRRSVDMAAKLLEEYGSCASLGELIHNEDVIGWLKAKGMRVVESPKDLTAGERVLSVISMTGTPRWEAYRAMVRARM